MFSQFDAFLCFFRQNLHRVRDEMHLFSKKVLEARETFLSLDNKRIYSKPEMPEEPGWQILGGQKCLNKVSHKNSQRPYFAMTI